MSSLNKEQFNASLPEGGVSLVVAGAGTGKTRTLVEKVGNIISDGMVKSDNILILTFSRKAAGEIKERIRSYIGASADNITSGTFHSFCLGLLKEHGKSFSDYFGFERFPSIIDEDEKNELRTELLKDSLDRFLGLPVKVITGLLDNINGLDKRTLKKLNRLGIVEQLKDFNSKFNDYKRSKNLLDFNDMIDYTIDLLANNQSLRRKTVERYRYIFVDEFQDTSEENFRLLKLLIHEDEPNLFMVGDDWQSIYGFRGSRVEYIINVKKFFPEASIHKLNLNYRSRREIVSLSNSFIKKNKYRTSKKLKSFNGRGGAIRNYHVENLEEEIETIKDILMKDAKNSSDIAILYRNNWQGDYISRNIQVIESGRLKLMTIHSSKGLEFDTVVIAGISDDIIPDASSDIEEERRLLYVALTRARESLHIIHHETSDSKLSVFARELGFSAN